MLFFIRAIRVIRGPQFGSRLACNHRESEACRMVDIPAPSRRQPRQGHTVEVAIERAIGQKRKTLPDVRGEVVDQDGREGTGEVSSAADVELTEAGTRSGAADFDYEGPTCRLVIVAADVEDAGARDPQGA